MISVLVACMTGPCPGPCHDPCPITFVGVSVGFVGFEDNLAIETPVDIQAGDVMIAHINGSPVRPLSFPPGWSLVRRITTETDDFYSDIYYKVAEENESLTYVWLAGGASEGAVIAYRGVDTAQPIDTHAGRPVGSETGFQYLTPSIITSADDELILALFGVHVFYYAPRSCDPPPGYVERYEVKTFYHFAMGADAIQSVAGPTGELEARCRPTSLGTAAAVALRRDGAVADLDGDRDVDLMDYALLQNRQ